MGIDKSVAGISQSLIVRSAPPVASPSVRREGNASHEPTVADQTSDWTARLRIVQRHQAVAPS